jgi:hypothetical protein
VGVVVAAAVVVEAAGAVGGGAAIVAVVADGRVVVPVAAVPVSLPQAVALTTSVARRATQERRRAVGWVVWLPSGAVNLVVFMDATIDLRGG